MREAILETLAELVAAATSAEAAYLASGKHRAAGGRLSRDPGVSAVIQFLKTVARKLGDTELLDQCVNADVQLCGVDELAEAVRELCIHHLFHEPKFRVDMSRYRALVNEHAARIADPEELRKLNAYLDEDRKLSQVYEAVKRRLCVPLYGARIDPDLRRPTFEDLKSAVAEEIAEVYRRADKHFATRLSTTPAGTPTP